MQTIASTSRWPLHITLFAVTAASVFITAASGDASLPEGASFGQTLFAIFRTKAALSHGAAFCGTLMAILLAHELGHYVAARAHGVAATLPYFLPLPLLSPFGTMGAFIRMDGAMPSRKALLDIGAAGPLAGLSLAIPLYALGAAHSRVVPLHEDSGGIYLGESILMRALEKLAAPAVPEGFDLELSPVAFAAWAGFFVTMINLLPVGQLDGGHVAFALFGKAQDRVARWVHMGLLAPFLLNTGRLVFHDVRADMGLYRFGHHVQVSLFWLAWFLVVPLLHEAARRSREEHAGLSARARAFVAIGLLGLVALGPSRGAPLYWLGWGVGLLGLVSMEVMSSRRSGTDTLDHPPVPDSALDATRRWIGLTTLAFFVLLFMPIPIAMP